MQKFLPFLLLCLYVNANAQDKKLLNNYKFRVDKFRAINVEGTQKGAFDNRQRSDSTFTGFKDKGISTNLNTAFFQISSTDNWQRQINIGFYSSIGLNNSRNTTVAVNSSKNKIFSVQPSVALENRYYHTKKMFIEFNGIAAIRFAGQTFNTSATESNIHNSNSEDWKMQLGLGYGRIENISDMQTAIWLHRNLEREKLLTEKLNETEIVALAQAITAARNTRLLDNRRFIKNILKQVDAALQKTGKTNLNNVAYFSTLNDIIFFAGNTNRQAGKRISLLGTIGQTNVQTKNEDKNTISNSIGDFDDFSKNREIRISYIAEKPINLQWQNTLEINAAANGLRSINKRNFSQNGVPIMALNGTNGIRGIEAEASYGYTYFPNTRTFINAKTITGFEKMGFNSRNPYLTYVGLNGKCNYFLTYATTVQLDGGISFQKSRDINNTIGEVQRFNGNLNVKLLVTL